MDSYTPLLDKTRLPQPSLQKFAVISIFSKLRSAPPQLGPDSEPGRDAISQCLQSTSPAVLDQSLREFCCLVADSVLDLSVGLLELHSALEGSEPKFVPLFVKALGFVVRLGFERRNVSCKFGSVENHPFVKILSSRSEVHAELVQQIFLFMVRNKQLGMVEVCEFLRPFFNFSIIRIPFSDSLSSLFVRQLVSSVASLCCSFPDDAMPVFKLLIGCLNYFPQKKLDEHKNFNYIVECTVDAYIVVLRHLVLKGSLVTESQMCGVELFGTVVSLCTSPHKHSSSIEPIVELLKCILVAQRDLSLQYKPELSSAILSLFAILIESELEHEQLCILKLLLFLLNWKSGTDFGIYGATSDLNEELLLIFPALNLMSATSKPVKKAASDLLFMLEKPLVKLLSAQKLELAINGGYPPISRPEFFYFRVLKHMWFQDQSILLGSSFLTLDSVGGSGIGIKEIDNGPKPWASQLREYLLWIVDRQKSSRPISASQKTFSNEMPLLCAIASVLMMHPSLWNSAIDLSAAIGLLDPKLGVPLLLVVLFYSNVFSRKDVICHNMLLKLLGMLPSLASQSAMIPLVVQTILPMLHKDAKPVLYATAIRLLCQTWEINDRVFGSLQGVLYPKGFTDFMYERNICISMAASICDVCRKNPDRGVDLILSVSACIESQDHIVQALGFQSLAHLCEADVIDFYTAWDVIAKHMLDYSLDPILAQSICLLLRWGAMDAEAYPEASRTILKILWDAGTTAYPDHELQWAKARASAFEALSQYEVSQIDKNILDFKKRSMEVLCSETNQDVLRAMEGFQVKIISHEHINRRRFIKDKKVPGSKVEKLLDVFPQVIFSSGKKSYARDLPGAALLCLSFTPKDLKNQGVSRGLRDVHVAYENALVDIAASLQLSRNIFVALLSLQSWKSFMRRWMRANVFLIDAKAESIALDRTSKAANDILKRTIQVSEESFPRSAENIALAIGALGAVLPPSAHTIKSTASKFLLSWLFQHEHEHRQWSAALSLGFISSSLHVTDHKQKFQNISGLIEVLCGSRSTLVKGACGVGLGFSCQDLLARIEAIDNPNMDKETYNMQEMELLGRTVKVLAHMLCQLAPSSSNILKSLSAHLPVNSDVDTNITPEWLLENFEDLEDDVWGVAGLVLGLANSIGALYRAGAEDAVLKIKDLIISWIPHVNYLVQNSDFRGDRSEKFLSIGSCVALPIVVAFCRRLELMDDKELDHLVNGYRELISELISVNKSSNFHKNLLMASCIGAGSLLSCILNEGVHSIKVEHLNSLMELFKKCYSNPYPPIIHLGGMLGVVNSLGASAGFFVNVHALTSSMHAGSAHKEHSSILGPLLSDPVCEQYVTSVIQDIFLVAQNSDDQQLQQYAAWAMSFLQNHLRSKELLNVDNNIQTDVPGSKSVTQSFSEDSAVMKLSLWLTSLNYSGTDTDVHVATVSTVLRCLSRAPRLPTLYWGAIIRRCMRYEVQVAKLLPADSADMRGTLREECTQFSLAHANQFDSLLTFLDELSDLSRFRSLELNLQAFLLIHLPDLVKLFSGSRLEKLFDDIKNFFSLVSSHQDPDQKSFLRISCWKGLYMCLEEVSLDSLDYIQNMEKCMEVLFTLLPASKSTKISGTNKTNMVEEWSKAVACLGKTRQEWLLDFLQVSHVDTVQGDAQLREALKKIQATAKLVRIGSFPLTQLGKLKAYILNFESLGIWDVLVEVVAALQQADTSVKRQWLVDAVEISCVSCYPSTSLQFLGLLSGSCCRYMPLLILDRITVLNDLPVTLTSLLSEPHWGTVAEPFVSYLWVSTERIYDWATSVGMGESESSTRSQSIIDRSENGMAAFLLRVMHCACVSLKDYLPLEKQLKLSNMLVKEEMG